MLFVYAFLYFFFTETEDPEGQFSQIVAETYYNYGANQDDVYFIGIDPTGDSLTADWWRVDYQVQGMPIIHAFTDGSNVHTICDAYGVHRHIQLQAHSNAGRLFAGRQKYRGVDVGVFLWNIVFLCGGLCRICGQARLGYRHWQCVDRHWKCFARMSFVLAVIRKEDKGYDASYWVQDHA